MPDSNDRIDSYLVDSLVDHIFMFVSQMNENRRAEFFVVLEDMIAGYGPMEGLPYDGVSEEEL